MAEISLTQDSDALSSGPPTAQVWNIFVVMGLAMTVSGALHLAVGWLPLQLQNAHWKFLISGATIDGFPVITASMIALGCGLIARGPARPLRLFAIASALFALGLAADYAIFLSTLTRIAELTQSLAEQEAVRSGVLSASASAIVTILLLGGLAWVAWERSTPSNRN